MYYMGYMPNDFVNGEGVSVSVWMSGCPFHCPGCHNPEAWDYKAGYEIELDQLEQKLDKAMTANNICRNFSILGGEPLCPQNIQNTKKLIDWCRQNHPWSKIFLWTGYYIENIEKTAIGRQIINSVDVIIDGPYDETKRDVSLHLRGSSNQRIIEKNKKI